VIVVKLGGSLLESGAIVGAMSTLLAVRHTPLVLVVGGGARVDQVRADAAVGRLDEVAAHAQAVFAMDHNAHDLSVAYPALSRCTTMEAMRAALAQGQCALWLPSMLALTASDVPASWSVTSDSLSAWLAAQLHAAQLIVVKSCDVPPAIATDAHGLQAAGVVDQAFPHFAGLLRCPWRVTTPQGLARVLDPSPPAQPAPALH
jgi:5-(aminomethyl)-3-furanmethanol phosphate kinase